MKVRVAFHLGKDWLQKISFEESHADLNVGDIIEMDFGSTHSFTGMGVREYVITAKNEIQTPCRGLDKEVLFCCKEVNPKHDIDLDELLQDL
jgi:hypothetical protein